MSLIEEFSKIVLIGCGATLIMDIWLLFLQWIGVQPLNFAYVGRLVGHWFRGRLAHASIDKASPIAHEVSLGWITHYTVGIVFAFLLAGIAGVAWVREPSPGPALLVGLCTVIFPLLIVQPAMGLGIAGSKTASPFRNRMRNLVNHGVFGLGLFLSACIIDWISR